MTGAAVGAGDAGAVDAVADGLVPGVPGVAELDGVALVEGCADAVALAVALPDGAAVALELGLAATGVEVDPAGGRLDAGTTTVSTAVARI
ncbi:MAG: hypothetical protein K5924_06390 [Chloroflexi bacterium]|nr:hypothetical protein [Chloroflexota bacterium]